MKAITSEKSTFSGVYSGRINKNKRTKDVENEEIRVYLSKLKELVPFMPKNRKLSKLEVIQYVIDYIYDLQMALETHPTLNSAAVHSAAVAMLTSQAQSFGQYQIPVVHRQPLGVLPPNSNVQVTSCNTQSLCSTSVSNTASVCGSQKSESETVLS